MTLASHCSRCPDVHEFDPADTTVVRRGDGFWLLATCPDRGVPLRVRLPEAMLAMVVTHPVLLDPEVRDYLHRKATL